MPTEKELLAAIDAAPDVDAPRLAHADWLEANGDRERADFIRRQLAYRGDSERYTAGLPTVRGMRWRCRRGYPEVVWFDSLKAFKDGWPLTAGRRISHVGFGNVRGGAKIAAEPALSSIRSLEFSETAPDAILAVLRSIHLVNLLHLTVRAHPADAGLVRELAAMPKMAGLRSLHVNHHDSEPLLADAVAALVNSPHLARLRSLTLECWLDEGGMRELFRPAALTGLTSLELGRTGVRSSSSRQAGLQDLGDGAAMPGLGRFLFAHPRHTGHYEGGDAGIWVARATRWASLRHLDLSGAEVGDEGAAALAGAAHLARLERLVLGRCKVSDAGAAALASSAHLHALTRLDLEHNLIGRTGVAAFGRSVSLPGLHSLTLTYNPAPEAIIKLVEARYREGGPPVEEAPAPSRAVPAPSAPVIGDADEDGLIRAIWADPWDETARLVYADWLEERGSPLHAAILRATPGERAGIAAGLDGVMKKDAPGGFKAALTDEGLVRVTIPLRVLKSAKFEGDGPAWMHRHHVAELIPDAKSGWDALFAAGWMGHVRGLSFGGRRFEAWRHLADSPHLAALSSLDLKGSHMHMAAELLLGTGLHAMRGLCRLHLGDVLQPDGVRALCAAPFAPHLRQLSLGGVEVRGLPTLVNAHELSGVVTLSLERYNLGDGQMRIIADATGLAGLRNLDVSGGYFEDIGADALAGSALLQRLSRLRLSVRHGPGRHITAAALGRLARAVPPRCRVMLAGEADAAQRAALAAILGERLTVEKGRPA